MPYLAKGFNLIKVFIGMVYVESLYNDLAFLNKENIPLLYP